MVAKKIREWPLPFVTLTEDTEILEKPYEIDYIRVNRIENEIGSMWKDIFNSISTTSGLNTEKGGH